MLGASRACPRAGGRRGALLCSPALPRQPWTSAAVPRGAAAPCPGVSRRC